MGNIFHVFLLTALVLVTSACSHKWQDPDTAMPAQNVSIPTILASPDAYDGSGVIVIGKIWHLKFESAGVNELGQEEMYTTFLLADRNGIGIDVFIPGEAPLTEGEFIKVVGLYSKTFQDRGQYFYSKIDAVRLESWSPDLKYWIREYEFD
jgi:hypothetical protein